MDRRRFLYDLPRLTFLCGVTPAPWRVLSRPRLRADPFTLGVASGDPLPDRCVIWTRLAPFPFEPQGGMNGQRTRVGWEVADDDTFSRIVRSGEATAAPELGFSVHVDVEGLEPGREYAYRFLIAEGSSPIGRLRTAPAPGDDAALRMAVVSCQHYETGFFTAFDHVAREELDLVAHLGDYIYEYAAILERVREHHGLEIQTLDDYRNRYAQYKADPALQAAHARCPWIVTWDDHEVDNNYAGGFGENVFESEEQMRLRRAMGYQAWWEHQPVRVPRARSWSDLDIRRAFSWGRTAQLWVLDTRQYRSDQACGDRVQRVPCEGWADSRRTMLGDGQERWLLDGIAAADPSWQVLVQQVMMAPYDSGPGEDRVVSMDQWSGYPAARDRLLRELAARAAGRTVVLTGDIHSNWVNDLHAGFDRPDQPLFGAEFVGTSISSGGDGSDEWSSVRPARDQNPHMKWHSARRGYVRCEVDGDAWRSDFRTVPYVTRPGAPVETSTSWRLESGRAGVVRM